MIIMLIYKRTVTTPSIGILLVKVSDRLDWIV